MDATKPGISMKMFSLIAAFALGIISSVSAQIPIQVRSNDNNLETQAVIRMLEAMISEHQSFILTKNPTELHVVINVTGLSSGDSVAIGALLEVRPPNGMMGVAARSNMVLTTLAESPGMARQLYYKLLIEDKMVNKLLYMSRAPVASGDLNMVVRLMQAAKAAADRGSI